MTVIPPASHQKFYQFTPPLLRPIRIQIQIHALHKTLAPATQPFLVSSRNAPPHKRAGEEGKTRKLGIERYTMLHTLLYYHSEFT